GAPSYWAYRLSSVRGFARYLHTLDPVNDVPPTDLLPYRSPRLAPYLYCDEEIAALMTAAGRLRNPKRALSYQTIIGLLATTGMRVGEALRLDLDDVHWEHRLLLIRNTKFGKSRLVPLAASTFAALGEYVQQRKRCYPVKGTAALFLSAYGTRVSHCSLSGTFHQLTHEIGLKPRSNLCRPRIHDLRHSFAIQTMLDWYRAGVDVQARLPLLSTYLGHVDPATTYWYLSAAPELLALAGERLERHLQEDRS
ncbi:MAG: tyrosine-type recombinase/integrase, partial [Actinobacteria bacterium]|nr:tyrosine-type recombinase/integrase [Actinomycetota bacterium]